MVVPSNCKGANCQTGGQGKNEYELTLGAAGAGIAGSSSGGGSAVLASLCAVQNPGCDPDDATSCSYASPTVGQGGATSNTLPGEGTGAQLPSDVILASAGTAGDASELGGSAAVATSAGGRSGAGAAGKDAGTGGAGTGGARMACRVQRDQLVVRTTCEPAGTGTTGAPCANRANCAAGFACVEENGTAQCRAYCCRGVSSCPSGTFCDQRFTKELVTTNERLTVSVCMPAVDCRFDEPFPCPADRACSCPAGKACGVVRSNGATACVVPGAGVEGQSCPCAAQHVCSDTLGTCFKICSLTSSDPACSSGFCQSSSSLPAQWGICVNSASLL